MAPARTSVFNPQLFLSKVGKGKTSFISPKKHTIFSQADVAEAVFYIQAGKVKLTVVSQQGKEAVIAILEQGAFFGESCLAGHTVRTATATAVEDSTILRIDKEAMLHVLHKEHAFAELFMTYLLAHTILSKRIWWISSLTPAKSGSRACCCCWPISAKKVSRSRSLRRSVRKRLPR